MKDIICKRILHLQKETDMILTTLVECQYEFVNLEHPQFRDNAQRYLGVQQGYGWFMNLVNEREASPLGDSFLTLQENDRKSPSSDSEPPKGREGKANNASKQKKRFFVRNSNESKFYDKDTKENSV